jgi:DNA polymerase
LNYKKIANWFLDSVNHDTTKKLKCEVANCPHIFAWGGVHGALKQYIYSCKNDEMFVMADVSQLYPFLMKQYKLLSRNVPKEGYKILEDTIATSLKLKAQGKKIEREPYKRFNNIIYGAEGDKSNAMFDPLHRNLICVFGQLLILDLIEKIESFTQLIQSNTDGILVKLKRKDFDKFDDIVYEWEQRTGLMMEFDYYKTVFQKDVNNYVIVDYDGKCKTKGAYVKGLTNLDYDLAIVNQAMVDYMLKKIPVSVTINNCNDLRMFQKIVKLTNKYKCVRHNNKDYTEKCFRVFASKSHNDSYIGKVKIKKGIEVSEKFANTPDNCFIENGDVTNKEIPEKLDRQWYIDLAIKRLDQYGVEV